MPIFNQIPENTRRFIYYAMKTYKVKSYGSGIQVILSLLQGQLSLSPEELRKEIDILCYAELVDTFTLEYDEVLILQYFDSDRNEILESLYNFCKENNRSLQDLIVNVNFSKLD